MKRGTALRLGVVLMLSACPVWAKWVELSGTGFRNGDGWVLYVDPQTIRKEGTLTRIWVLADRQAPDAMGVHSRRALYEFDCRGERMRVLSLSAHSEAMAAGKLLEAGDFDPNWGYIAPGTIGSAVSTVACR